MKTILTKEQEIQSYMTLLGISKKEAEQLWEDDHSDEVLPEVAEMERKAKTMRRYEKADTPKKSKKKERTVDEEKAVLMDLLTDTLVDNEILITNQKSESETHFEYNGTSYTLKLIRHRAPK